MRRLGLDTYRVSLLILGIIGARTALAPRFLSDDNLTMKNIVIIVLSLGIGGALIIALLGLRVNTGFFVQNRNECISTRKKDIQGCAFWRRNDYLRDHAWQAQFKRDEAYCAERYPEYRGKTSIDRLLEESLDPRCNRERFYDQKRRENWTYLVSDSQDQYLTSCQNDICPKQYLFKPR